MVQFCLSQYKAAEEREDMNLLMCFHFGHNTVALSLFGNQLCLINPNLKIKKYVPEKQYKHFPLPNLMHYHSLNEILIQIPLNLLKKNSEFKNQCKQS